MLVSLKRVQQIMPPFKYSLLAITDKIIYFCYLLNNVLNVQLREINLFCINRYLNYSGRMQICMIFDRNYANCKAFLTIYCLQAEWYFLECCYSALTKVINQKLVKSFTWPKWNMTDEESSKIQTYYKNLLKQSRICKIWCTPVGKRTFISRIEPENVSVRWISSLLIL